MLRLISWLSACYVAMYLGALLVLQESSGVVIGYNRGDFPSDFIFGAGSSASQVEGAAFEDGRTPSILDAYTHKPGNVDGYDGEKRADEYHKYKEDVGLMVETGLDAYRFSISWSRLIPNGRGAVNPKAVEYYNNLINELVSHGIQPHATMMHGDLPQALEDDYTGWVNKQIVEDFTTYADVCFREFGDRVLHWTTYNEPNIFTISGYDSGSFPPRRCSAPFGSCSRGNSTTEPYIVAHNMLLAHASVVRLYRKKYQRNQHGYIGINLHTAWFLPETNTKEDLLAVQRSIDFIIGWFMHPLVFGDYPDIMKKSVSTRLPSFTQDESNLVKNSFDFIGVNCYIALVVKDNPSSLKKDVRDCMADWAVTIKYMRERATVVQNVLEYFKQLYGNPPIYIHEAGFRTLRIGSLTDTARVKYLKTSIGSLLDAVRNGSNVRGYFVWSFLDLYELVGGNKYSFGLYYVDLDDPDLKRYPKLSAHWYSSFVKRKIFRPTEIIQQVSNNIVISQALSDQ